MSAVYVSEGDTVYAGQSLIYLTDTEYTGEYERLLSQRRELEAQMQALFSAYERGGVYAESSGHVTGLNKDIISSAGGSTGSGTHLAARLLGSLQRLSAAVVQPVDDGKDETPEPDESEEPSEPGQDDDKVTEKFGKVTAIDEEAGTVTVRLTDDSDLILDTEELEKLGALQIKVGNILALGYDESGTLVSVTVYSNSGGSTKYSVTVTLPCTEDMLTGMNAAVRVQLAENGGLLLIPLAAVQEDADGIYVCTGYDKSSSEAAYPVAITTGLSDGENVEVLSGLSEGDTVYYRYADTLEYSFVK